LGWIGLESGSPSGNLTWIKPASRSTALYTNGFTNLISRARLLLDQSIAAYCGD
jgi:hypothetical protein